MGPKHKNRWREGKSWQQHDSLRIPTSPWAFGDPFILAHPHAIPFSFLPSIYSVMKCNLTFKLESPYLVESLFDTSSCLSTWSLVSLPSYRLSPQTICRQFVTLPIYFDSCSFVATVESWNSLLPGYYLKKKMHG